MSTPMVKNLFIHPVKGLTPQECDRATGGPGGDRVFLTEGHGIKGDRAFALMFLDIEIETDTDTDTFLEHNKSFIPTLQNIHWMSKTNCAVQNDWPALAVLNCHYDFLSQFLTVKKEGKILLNANTNTKLGRVQISRFFTRYLKKFDPTPEARHSARSPVVLVGSSNGNTRYPDRETAHISLVNQATLDQLSSLRNPVSESPKSDAEIQAEKPGFFARRFRPNIVLDGIAPWEEFNYIDQTFQLGDAHIYITARINRCVNIEINPETGERDLPLLSLLKDNFGHKQMGILATVVKSGYVHIGDRLTPLENR
ncbi:MAG: MOSC domain-containing protein [Microcoleaceae cyanobacterium]